MYIPVIAKSSAMINGNYEDRTKTIVKNFPILKQGNRGTVNMSKRLHHISNRSRTDVLSDVLPLKT